MKTKPQERGQALIIIVFAMLGLFGITALAVDGGMSYSDRRHAQNAADSAALAAALANIRGNLITQTAMSAAAVDGYDDNQSTNWVTVTKVDTPRSACSTAPGKDITVQIKSTLRTYFGPVIGITEVENTVTATARSCEPYVGPLFNGAAIVALAKDGVGFDARGNPNWNIQGGGIFSNSAGSPSARCKGAKNVIIAPSLQSVGGTDLTCDVQIPPKQIAEGVPQWQYKDYAGLLPEQPLCDGTAKKVGSFWVAQALTDGSKVAFTGGDMQFGPGLFCVTNSPGPYHGTISGNGVTFYIMPTNFRMTFNGGGGFGGTAGLTAPTSGKYTGVLIFASPQTTGSFDFLGNGSGNIQGSVILPSIDIRMFGNSNSQGYDTQIIANRVTTGGNADIKITYNAKKGYQEQFQPWLTLLR